MTLPQPSSSDSVPRSRRDLREIPSADTAQGALPDSENPPPGGQQSRFGVGVARAVLRDLLRPELGPRRRQAEQRAVMAVPETAVNEGHRPSSGKHEIRSAGQLRAMKAIAHALSVQGAAQDHLRLRVLALHSRHGEPALFGRERIDPAGQARL